MVVERVRARGRSITERLGIVGEFLAFLWDRKLFWMVPLFVMLVLLGGLLLFAQSSALSPFIYTLV